MYLEDPAAPGYPAFAAVPLLIAESNIAGNKERTISGDLRTETIFVVMARHRPGTDCFIHICLTIIIGIHQFGELAALRAVKGAVLIGKSQYLVQAAGKLPVKRARAG